MYNIENKCKIIAGKNKTDAIQVHRFSLGIRKN